MSIQHFSWSITRAANRDWFASLRGTNQTQTITLDLAKLTAGTHAFASTDLAQPYSRVVSGVPVGRITVSGLCGPFGKDATDERRVLAEAFFAPEVTKCPAEVLRHDVAVS